MSVMVEVSGDYALFSRPEMKVERVSYDVITPSAARGLLESIYWHPRLRWVIDTIYVLSPIQYTNIRRNEVKSKASAQSAKSAMLGSGKPLFISTTNDIQQRAALLLKNVHYVIKAHFEMTENAAESDNPGKFSDIINRRLEKGQCYSQPYFGCREFAARFSKWKGGEIITAYPDTDMDLGFMLYDIDYSDKENYKPMFFRAKLIKGVLNVGGSEVFR